jgi:hypothetical protein
MVEISKDDLLTHSVLNYLRATFVGQIVFHKVLSDLKSSLVSDSYIEGAHKALDKIDPWLKDLYEGMPIFSASWTAPETFEAIRAFGYLKDAKQDLAWLATQLEGALALPNLADEREAIRLLVAALVRTANVRVEYLNGVGSFYAHHNDDERINIVRPQFLDAKNYLDIMGVIYETFSGDGPFAPELVERLRREAELTPSDFRAQIYDAIVLLNSYNKRFDYDSSEISADEAAKWKEAEVPVNAAGYWIAYNLTPQEAIDWAGSGLGHASLAANWKRSGFTHETAGPWLNAGFAPAIARLWKEANFDPERAATLVQRGITTPEQAAQNKQQGGQEEDDAA